MTVPNLAQTYEYLISRLIRDVNSEDHMSGNRSDEYSPLERDTKEIQGINNVPEKMLQSFAAVYYKGNEYKVRSSEKVWELLKLTNTVSHLRTIEVLESIGWKMR